MKITIIFLISFNVVVYAQQFKLGGTADFLTGNKYIDWEVGPSLIMDYSFNSVPISVQGIMRFHLSSLSTENDFSTDYTYTVFSAGVAVNYYPIHWAIEPYVGAGIFYNSNNIMQDGTPAPFLDGTIHSASNIKNNLSTEIIAGIKFSANSPINFIVQVAQTFNRPAYDLVILNTRSIKITRTTKKDKFDFSSLFLKIGLLFLL